MTNAERKLNETAYRKIQDQLDRRYPFKQFVAFHNGHIVLDSADFDELQRGLRQKGIDQFQSLIVRIGDELPEYVEIMPLFEFIDG